MEAIRIIRTINKAHEQLKIHDKIQKEFIDIAAHELRSPIQPILSLSDLDLLTNATVVNYAIRFLSEHSKSKYQSNNYQEEGAKEQTATNNVF
jgi:signal transduction histidine kinase